MLLERQRRNFPMEELLTGVLHNRLGRVLTKAAGIGGRQAGELTREEARRHPSRNLITRALGPDISADCDGYICPMQAGEYLLLCSDGLVNTVTDQEMLFEVIHGDGPDTCLDRLLAIAKRQGAPDNVTAVLMQMQ